MAILTTRPRGTNDFLPAETPRWQYVERTLLSTAALYGYGEIRTPTFEHTELFQRGVGDTTDVVNKEMYTFTDKGDRSITLRPEGTAGICRAAIENGLLGDALPLKVSYVFNCFRYEKAQRGRFRQFHQFGVECYGAIQPVTDAEVISLAWEGMQTLGLKDLTLAINSIGWPHLPRRVPQGPARLFREPPGGSVRNLQGAPGEKPHAHFGLQIPRLRRDRQRRAPCAGLSVR